jgi:hypothetical protein
MSVPTATRPATSMSPTQLESSPSEPIALAVARNGSRSRLIDTISRNVMVWTHWSGGKRDKSNQSGEGE